MSSRWRDWGQPCKKVVWKTFLQQFHLQRIPKTVGCLQIWPGQRKKLSLHALVRHFVVCSALDRLSLAYRRWTEFSKGGKNGRWALLLLFRILHLQAVPFVWGKRTYKWFTREDRAKRGYSGYAENLVLVCIHEWLYKHIPVKWAFGNVMRQAC